MTIFFQAFGGLGLFLMGMKIMSEGMQKTAGNRLRKTLNYITSNRFFAIFVGLTITAVIQSSSATTVMVVGFANASLMSLKQAIGVILGANIGTTVTGWIVTLKIVKYSMPLIGTGVFIRFFSKNEKWKYIGEIIFGFGILFLGMETMKNGFAPLRESESFIGFFTKVDGVNYVSVLLGVAIGAVTTVIVQSSSATIGITIALASQGLINFDGAVSLILGENIGTTITAILASVGANYHAKRAALAHTMFNFMGVIVIVSLFFPFVRLVENLIPGIADLTVKSVEEVSRFGSALGTRPFIGAHIAAAHSIFNISNVILFSFLIPFISKACEKLIPDPVMKSSMNHPDYSFVDSVIVDTPSLGIAETEKKLNEMSVLITESSLVVEKIIETDVGSTNNCDKVLRIEKVLDNYKKFINEFLISLSSHSLSDKDAHSIGDFITLSNNLEKYGDHLEHIALIFDKINRKKLSISEEMRKTILDIFKDNNEFYHTAFSILSKDGDGRNFIDKAPVINRRIKKLIKEAKVNLFDRLNKKIYKNDSVLHYMDILNYLDGMRAQAFNISEVTTGSRYE
ncbi:MAG: Na/Pi cotransporter family protein [Acidobacteriota bacterium]